MEGSGLGCPRTILLSTPLSFSSSFFSLVLSCVFFSPILPCTLKIPPLYHHTSSHTTLTKTKKKDKQTNIFTYLATSGVLTPTETYGRHISLSLTLIHLFVLLSLGVSIHISWGQFPSIFHIHILLACINPSTYHHSLFVPLRITSSIQNIKKKLSKQIKV